MAGALAVAVQIPVAANWNQSDFLAWFVLAGFTIVAEQFPITMRRGTETEVFALADAVWMAGLMLAPADVLILAVGAGGLAGRVLRQTARLKVIFNVGQYVVAISAAATIYALVAPDDPVSPLAWGVGLMAMSVFFLINTGAVALVIALVQGQPFREVLQPTLPLSALHWAGNMAIGLLAVLVATANPVGLPLVLAPLALSYFGYRGWLRTIEERDEMREMARAADAISEQGDLRRRIPAGGDDEVGRLATTLNAMLDRLEGAFNRERRFLSEASHELRTPITIGLGHLEVLLAQRPQHAVAETVAVVVDELKRMGRIVEDMIAIARMEQPQFLRLEPVALGDLLCDVGAKAETLFDGRLRVEPVAGDSVVRADPQRLTQALLNLLNNAAVYAPGSEVSLRLRDDDGWWRIEVADRGGGLPPGREDELFEPFRRASRMPGTGLGLAIVRSVAEAHGGAAGVTNRPGIGATFWMRLPR